MYCTNQIRTTRPLTLNKVACQPLPKAGLVVFILNTTTVLYSSIEVGLDFSWQKRCTLRARSRSSLEGIDPIYEINIKLGMNYNWFILCNDPSSLSTSRLDRALKVQRFCLFWLFTVKTITLRARLGTCSAQIIV